MGGTHPKPTRRVVGLAGIAAIALAVAACSSSSPSSATSSGSSSTGSASSSPIKVGLLTEKTGIYQAYLQEYLQGFNIGMKYATNGTGKVERAPGRCDRGR